MEAETKAKEGAMFLVIASIICGFIGLFIYEVGSYRIVGEFFGAFGAILGYYAVKEGSKLGLVGLVFGGIVFLLGTISIFL